MARIFSTTGFGFAFDDSLGQITAVTGPATLSLSFAEDSPVLRYTQIFPPDPGVLPEVEIDGDAIQLVAINDLLYGDNIDASIGRLVWSGGTTDVLSLFISDNEQYLFRLGGAPLPSPATAADANLFLASVAQPVALPPAGSGLEAGVDFALTSLPGWSFAEANDTTTFTVDAFSFIPTDTGMSGVQPGEISFVLTDPEAQLSYQSLGLEVDSGPSGAGATIARAGFSDPAFTILVDGQPITASDSDYQIFFARITTSGGTTHDVLNLEFLATGRQYLVSLGGDPLPDGTNAGAVAAFADSITSVDPIPAGAGAAGEQIALSSLPGVSIDDGTPPPPPEPTGDPAVLTFAGYKMVYDGDDLSSVDPFDFQLALPADDVAFSYVLDGTDDDGLPLVNIGGSEPYAVLLDGISLPESFDTSIVRITANGIDYDVLLLVDRVNNTDYIIQLDGTTPLPFGSLASANAFREAADGPDGAVGVIPAGSPLAPGAVFRMSDSSYLVGINHDPAFILAGDQYNARPAWGVADGAGTEGSLTLLNGQTLTLDSDDRGPFLQVGRGAGALGTVTVAGTGSRMTLEAGGDSTDGSGANFGRDGGTGILRVLDGADFEITDPNGTTGGANADGRETLHIGRNAGAQGIADVVAGALSVTGTGASATIGRNGGNGVLYLSEGADFVVAGTSAAPEDFTQLRIGHQSGGTGTLRIDHSFALVQAGLNGSARVDIGREGGTGSLVIAGTDVAPYRDGLFVVGNAFSESIQAAVGTGNGSLGSVVMNGGQFGLLNAGVEVVRTGGIRPWIDAPGTGGEAQMRIGYEGGTGTLTASASAYINTIAMEFARTSVGVGGTGSTGTVQVSGGSEVSVVSLNDNAELIIGQGVGAQGSVTVTGSELSVVAENLADQETYAWVLVGTQGGTGSLTLDNTDAEVRAGHMAGVRVGTRWPTTAENTGTGSITLRNGTELLISSDTQSSNFWVGGGEGSSASANILSGSVLDMGGNGWLAVGLADPQTTPGGVSGTLTIDGAGTRTVGVRELQVGGRGSSGAMTVSNGALAYIGGPDMLRNANADFGWGEGSIGTLTITNAAMAVQAGVSTNQVGERGASIHLGTDGGTANVTITGGRATSANPDDLRHGMAVLGYDGSAYATITIGGWDPDSVGHVTVSGASIAALNSGDVLNPDGTETTVDWGGHASIRVGSDGGTGTLIVENSGDIVIVGGGDDSAELSIGRGGGATGTFILRDGSEGEITSLGRDAWLLIGSEGGATGSAQIVDSSLHITGARHGGVRVGTSWFDAPGLTGTGELTVTDGAQLRITAANSGNFYVGGGAGSSATALIDAGSRVVMDGTAHRLAIVGGTPAFIAGTGGQGSLTISGAGSELAGVRDVLVGTNGGAGSLTLSEGGRLGFADAGGGRSGEMLLGVGIGRVRADEPDTTGTGSLTADGVGSGATMTAANLSRLIVGASGASGQVQITDGANISLNAAVSAVEIGIDGGMGRLDVMGDGSSLSVTGGTDGRIHLGRLRYAGAETGEPGSGMLRIGTGATVTVTTKVEVGNAGGHSGALVMAGGTLLAPLTELYAGTGLTSSTLLGHGQITGTLGQPAVLLNGSSMFVGDDVNAIGARVSGTGVLNVSGHVVQQASAAHFDIGGAAGGYDQLVVNGSYTMDGGSLNIALGAGAESLLGATGLRLISASGGIVLNEVELVADSLSSGTAITTELRADGTELWAVLDNGTGGPDPLPLPEGWADWLNWIGGGGGAAPEAPSTGRPASNIADPHLITFDGLGYSFHAAGEFVLTRPIAGTGFEVQSRMSPVGDNASENVVMAARLDGGNVVVDAATPNSILVNGVAVTMAAGDVVAVGSDLVYRVGNTYHLIHRHGDPDGDAISTASAVIIDGRLDITMLLDASMAGQVEGLLGNYDGDQNTDLSLPDGTLVSRPLVFGDDPDEGIIGLYGVYRDAWRVTTEEQSLFTYDPGEGPNSFYLPDYPARMITIDDFDPSAVDAAEAVLIAAGLDPDSLPFQNALFDLLSTGNESYVAAANTQQQQIDALPETAPPVTAPEVVGGALDGLVSITGRLLDTSDAAFAGGRVTFTPTGATVGHIRTTAETGDFAFEVLPVAGGQINASRAFNPDTDGAITVSDALDVLRISVGLQPAFGPASAEALIAADIDQSGAVTVSDALSVLRAAVGLATDAAPRWVFVDATADLDGITANAVTYDTGITLGAVGEGVSELALKGILLGQLSEFG